jgi:amidase
MDEADIAYLSASDLLKLLGEKQISSRELLDVYLRRVDKFNPDLNAIVTLDAERASDHAAAADEATAHGESWGLLHGLPMTVKDVFETAGLRTTAGSPEFTEYVPDRDAVIVRRLKAAGAVIFGKTNTPFLASDGQTYNEVFGTTNNPWELTRTPGGSSGGCCAAVATGLTSLGIGSDIGGSIRVPASFCGIFGHKSTFGLIPTRGHIPPIPPGTAREDDMLVVGPLTRDARDLDLALSGLAGPTSQEALNWKIELPKPTTRPLSEHRVAVWANEDFCPVESAIQARLLEAASALRSAGASVDEEARPGFSLEESHQVYVPLLRSIFGGERTHQDWLGLENQRGRLRDLWADFFTRYDVLLAPVCSTLPFPHLQVPWPERRFTVNGRERPYEDFIVWTGPISVSYLPSTTVPVGITSEGLPVGVQVVGPHLSDRRTIDFAGKLSTLLGGVLRPPGY